MDDDNVTPRRLCAAHKGAKPVSAVEPGWLCVGCEKRTVAALWDIARLWGQLVDISNGLGARDGGGGSGSNSQAPTRLDVLSLMDPRSRWDGDLPPAAALLRGWSRYVAGERKFTPPRSVPDQVRFLTMNFPWLMEDRVVGEFCRDVWRVSRALAGVCGETRKPVASCQAPTPDEGECGGPLFQDRDGAASVSCAKCGDTFSDGAVFIAFGELRRLGLILGSKTTMEEQ